MEKKLVIDLTNADGLMIVWLENLFNEELDDTKGTIENEKLWKKGSDTEEQIELHEANIQNLLEYQTLLEDAIKQLQ